MGEVPTLLVAVAVVEHFGAPVRSLVVAVSLLTKPERVAARGGIAAWTGIEIEGAVTVKGTLKSTGLPCLDWREVSTVPSPLKSTLSTALVVGGDAGVITIVAIVEVADGIPSKEEVAVI